MIPALDGILSNSISSHLFFLFSLNLGFNRGDSDENVRENYHRIANALDMNYDRMCLSKQTHTTNVVVVDEKDAGNGLIKPLPYDDVDGLITNVKDMPLVTFYADCVPLFFYDPVKEVVALSHSGWQKITFRENRSP